MGTTEPLQGSTDRAALDALVLAHASEFEGGFLFSSDMSEEAERAVQTALLDLLD